MPVYIPWMQDYPSSIARELIRYEELEIQIKQITGYNLDTLLKLFAMGYTLEKPKYDQSINQFVSER